MIPIRPRERRLAAIRGLDPRARWAASDPAGLDWPVPWTPGYSCEGCGGEPVLA